VTEQEQETQAEPESPFVAPDPKPDTITHPEGEPAITEEDAAEAEETDEDAETIEGPDDEPNEPQEPQKPGSPEGVEPGVAEAQLLSERDIEKRFAKLDAENTRHRKRLGEILEEDALHIVPCPVCMDSFHGWVFDPQHIPLQDDQRERTLQLLNLADFEDIPQASWAVKCETCNGHGRVKTGSRAEGREVTQCLDCKGAGWHNRHHVGAQNGHADIEPAPVTGPTVFGLDDPDPRVLSLKEEGWLVVPPTTLPVGT
jgi:hypothetical protein